MKKPTVDEHIVPRTYLKAFSLPSDDRMIFSYDFETESIVSRCVPIKSVCYEENLYEIRNAQGEIVRQNYIEDCLAQLERIFYQRRKELLAKASVSNLHCRSFLSIDEKAFWKLYIAIQLLRYPETLNTAKAAFDVYLKEQLQGDMSSDIAKLYCLPFLSAFEPQDQSVLSEVLLMIDNMSICTEICESGRFVTSDRPLFIHSVDFPKTHKLDQVVLPLSPSVQLFLHTKGETNRKYRNIVRVIDKVEADDAIVAMAFSAKRFLFSNRKLEDKEFDLLRLGRKQKELSTEKNMSLLVKEMEESL